MPFEWVTPETEQLAERTDFEHQGAKLEASRPFVPSDDEKDDYGHSAFGPLVIIAGVVTVVYLVDKVIGWVRGSRNNGLIVDTTSGRMVVKEHPSIDRGTVIVVTKNGVQKFDSNQQSGLEDALKAAGATVK